MRFPLPQSRQHRPHPGAPARRSTTESGAGTLRRAGLRVRAAALAFILTAASAAAQQVNATLSPTIVAQGQVAEYAITYEGPQTNLDSLPSDLQVPGLDIQGPQNMQNFTLRNNVATFRIELIWQLSGSQPGRYTIPAQTVVFNGQPFTTKELVLEVREGPPPTPSFEPILRLKVDKTDLWVGEVTPISITALFHRRTQLRKYDHPKLPRENVVVKRFPPPGPAPSVEVNGERFQPIEFISSLSALREGQIVVGPATLECVVDFPLDADGDPGRRTQPGFPPSIFQRMNTRQITLTSEPVTINVKPLPTEGRPADFAGAVGRFALMSRLAQPAQDMKVGDPISVDLIVTGEGNFDTLSAPIPAVTEGWKNYPTKVIQENRGSGLEPGSQVWNQVIVPQQPVTEVPAFVLSFFDPATATYQTIRSAPLPVTVLPEPERPDPRSGEAPTKDFSFVDASLPEEKLNDILALRPPTGGWTPLTPRAQDDALFWAAQAVPAALLLAFAGVGWQRRQRARQAADQRAREGKPRLPADIRRDLRRTGLSRREFYTLAREFVQASEYHTGRPAHTAGLNGELDTLLERQARYCYAGLADEATAPLPRPEQKEALATLEKLAR
jgi:hypothetical protein